MCVSSPLSRLLTRFPLWSLLLGVLAGIYWADYSGTAAWLIVASIGTLIALMVRRQAITFIALGIILGNGIHGLQIDHQRSWVRAAHAEELAGPCSLTGTIIDTGPNQDGPYLIKTSRLSVATKNPSATPPNAHNIRLLLTQSFENKHSYKLGDIVEIAGQLQAIDPTRNPHGFNRPMWLHRQGVNLTVIPQNPITVRGIRLLHYPVRTMANWRLHLREKMTTGIHPDSQEAQLIRAVVLGERPPRPSGMIDHFRNSGTLHVFAVSGLHVGMVGTIIGSLLWFLRVPRWVLISGIIFSMAVYAGITGLRPPSVRAVIMASVLLTGFLVRRQPCLINSLAASAIAVLLWDGHQLFTPGFQLSYGVLLTLSIASAFWIRVLKPMAEIDPFMPRLLLTPWQERILNWKKWLRNSLSVSMAAWMGSTPLMWIHFGIITPIAIIAGIPLMLFVFMILALAMLSIPVGAIWTPAGEAVNHTNAIIARTTYSMAEAFAHVPGGHWHKKPQRPEKGRIIVFDVPYGGAASLIDISGGIMLDSGRSDQFYRHILPTLTSLNVRPDSLIVSHADTKHCGGMSHCLDHFHPHQALIPRTDLLSKSYRDFLKKSEVANCRLIIPQAGQVFPVEPGVHLEILHAPVGLAGNGRADDTGLVTLLHWHGWRVLFTGDAGFITETRLLDSGLDLRADVIVTGRNRDDYTGQEAFYRAVSPKAIISSNYAFPEHESIPASWFNSTKALGITTIDQRQSGAVTLTIEGENLVLTPTLMTADTHVIRH